jgi:hypothetical protein
VHDIAVGRAIVASARGSVLGNPFLDFHFGLEQDVPSQKVLGHFAVAVCAGDTDRQVLVSRGAFAALEIVLREDDVVGLTVVGLLGVCEIITFVMACATGLAAGGNTVDTVRLSSVQTLKGTG